MYSSKYFLNVFQGERNIPIFGDFHLCPIGRPSQTLYIALSEESLETLLLTLVVLVN